MITELSAEFQKPYIDQEEDRDRPAPHRYFHGGFEGTTVRFSFYLPPKDSYQGRFFHHITPVPGGENDAQGQTGEGAWMAFSLASGAAFVETNEGGLEMMLRDRTLAAYKANAAAAFHFRTVAQRHYGPHQVFGYAFGGSGGAYRTIGGAENTTAWDGVVPFVIGSPQAIPNVYTVRMLALRVLGPRLADCFDAFDAGGTGTVPADLSAEQRGVWDEVTALGFPPRGWFNWRTLGMGALDILYAQVAAMDPGYFDDFWNVPGYQGAEPTPSMVQDRVRHRTKVVAVHGRDGLPGLAADKGSGVDDAWQKLGAKPVSVTLQVESVPQGYLEKLNLWVGQVKIPVVGLVGNAVLLGAAPDGTELPGPGAEVVIDNSDFLAFQYYHRHQVPGPEYPVWDFFRQPDGTPKYPQRPFLVGPLFARGTVGSLPTGAFHGKMIVLETLLDQDAFPWQADWYAALVRAQRGADAPRRFRLWFHDRANHTDSELTADGRHLVSYLGALQQALRDLARWVETGEEPAPDTAYRIHQGQVLVPDTVDRGGIQPLVTLRVNGAELTEVGPGEAVTLSVHIQVPPGAGRVTAVEWDVEGTGTFTGLPVTLTDLVHFYGTPGVYFPAVRVALQRHPDDTPFAVVRNLSRARVVQGGRR